MLFNVITTIAVAVPVFVLAAQIPDPMAGSDGIAIPLTKRSDTNAREFHATSHDANIICGPSGMDGSERNTGTPHSSAVKRDGSAAAVDLIRYSDDMWYGTISIGTPPKSFTVQFSTSSSDLFVPAATGDENCKSHVHLWDPASPQITNLDLNTYPPSTVDLDTDFELVFADGSITRGKQYTDHVTIAGLTADIQTIGAATTYSENLRASIFAPDGILGLAFPAASVFHGQSPLLHTLYKEGKLSQPVFAFRLTTFGAELYVGGTNEGLYIHNTLVFTPVINPEMALWEVKIDNIQVNGHIVLTDVTAVIDTSAHLIFGDPERVSALHKAVDGALVIKNSHYYTFPCGSFPSVTFTIGGKSFSIPDLNQGQITHGSRHCFSGIASVENSAFWSIGTLFLQPYYTVFDFNSESPRVGFADLAPMI